MTKTKLKYFHNCLLLQDLSKPAICPFTKRKDSVFSADKGIFDMDWSDYFSGLTDGEFKVQVPLLCVQSLPLSELFRGDMMRRGCKCPWPDLFIKHTLPDNEEVSLSSQSNKL